MYSKRSKSEFSGSEFVKHVPISTVATFFINKNEKEVARVFYLILPVSMGLCEELIDQTMGTKWYSMRTR